MNKNYEIKVLLVVTEEHDFRDTANCKLVSKRRLGLPVGATFLTQKVELLEEGKSVSQFFHIREFRKDSSCYVTIN